MSAERDAMSYWISGRVATHIQRWARAQAPKLDGGWVDGIVTPHDRVPIETAFELWRACAAVHPTGFALGVGASMAVHTLPTLRPLLTVTTNTRSILRVLVDGSRLVTNAAVVSLDESPTRGGIYMQPLLGSHPLEAMEFALAHWAQLVHQLTGRDVPPSEVHIPFPDSGTPHADFFRAPVRYGTERAALIYSTEALDTPCLAQDPDAEMLLRTLLEERSRDQGGTHAARTRGALLSLRATSGTRLTDAAEHLATSARSLQRGLQQDGVRFRDMLNCVLCERAFRLLRQPNLSIDEVADELGYSRRSFTRAFTRWTGSAPAAWRRRDSQTAAGERWDRRFGRSPSREVNS